MKIEEKENILEKLTEMGYVEYGKFIPTEVFEELFQTNINEAWDFLGPYLQIKEFLDENGYLCTSADLPSGSLRIFDVDELAYRQELCLGRIIRRIKKLHSCIANTNVESLSQNDLRKSMHLSDKVTSTLYSLKSNLSGIS